MITVVLSAYNVADFPTITFKSTSVKGSVDKLEVSGDLTVHGTTKPITMMLEKSGEGVMQGQILDPPVKTVKAERVK